MGRKLDFALGVLNGAVGDYLARTDNGLATKLGLVHRGEELSVTSEALTSAYPSPTARVVILLHGLMCTEDVFTFRGGGDYGSFLARDLAFTPLYVRYNTGRSIAENGAALAELLERLVTAYPRPIDEIAFVGYSMGGLVVRSACHVAGMAHSAWLSFVRRAVYVGTPHLGAPMERGGRALVALARSIGDPYADLVAEIANLRSTGVKDLGDAVLRDEDRLAEGTPRRAFGLLEEAEHPVPLLPSIRHCLIAGHLANEPWLADFFGDAVVPRTSASYRTGQGLDVLLVPRANHLALAHHPDVYERIRTFLEPPCNDP